MNFPRPEALSTAVFEIGTGVCVHAHACVVCLHRDGMWVGGVCVYGVGCGLVCAVCCMWFFTATASHPVHTPGS